MASPVSTPRARRYLARLGMAAFALVAVFLMSTLTTLAAGGTTGNLSGTVVSAKGVPVAAVAVTLVSPSSVLKTTTDVHGSFRYIGVPTDTYAISFQKTGFQSRTITGVTIVGDGSVSLGNVVLTEGLKTIAKIVSVSANSSFNPTQTQDTYSVTGQRIQQALGNAYSTDEAALVLSAPGVVQTYDSTNGAGISIRGSLAVELGYQYDGIPFSAPFFNANGSQGFINGINGGSGGGLQVVSGAGDATQGNVGGGIINTIVPRGTYPATGNVDMEFGGPYYDHTLNFNYGAATDNGHFSNYLSFSASRYVPDNGPINVPSTSIGAYFGTSYAVHNDFVDNMVFRFGKRNNQTFQILGRLAYIQTYNGYGGLNGLSYFQGSNSPSGQSFLSNFPALIGGSTAQQNAYFMSLIPAMPYAPANPNAPVTSPEITDNAPLHFLKFGYTNSLNSTTFLNISAYNWGILQGGSNYTNYPNAGLFGTGWAVTGGTRTGYIASLTHQFGEKSTVTLEGNFENARPYWDGQTPGLGLVALAYIAPSYTTGNVPTLADWAQPANTAAPISAGNPCPITGGCYIYSQLLSSGKWTGTMPQIPTMG
ncbi:MAG: carboxypeptidase regulatory-like domain-containing protein, partial [Vulcanimicrobiaceae bacterium]